MIMKKILLLAILIVTGSMIIWSQVPQAMTYKAVAKDDWGVALPNKTITLRFTILQGSGTGTLVYQEKHTTTTNKFGLMDVEIGKGTPLLGAFDMIDWSTGIYYIQIEMDPNGGTNFRLEDPAHQLLSVPYAFYALKSGSADETGDMDLKLQQILDEILELKSSSSAKFQEILDILNNDEPTSFDNIAIIGYPDEVSNVPTSIQLNWVVTNPDWGFPLNLPKPSLMYDVYLGTTDNTTQVGLNLIVESLTLNNLQFNTTYYWRVVIRDDYNHTKSSEVWSFTTEIEPL